MHGSAMQVVIGHLRFKGEIENRYPDSSETGEPRTTKIGTCNLGPNLTSPAKVGPDRCTGVGAPEPQSHGKTFFFWFLGTGYSPNRPTDFDDEWHKRRAFTVGSAFWGSR